jgi:tRNA pseudouridine38-40 synthase
MAKSKTVKRHHSNNVQIKIAFDGEMYSGWQRQPNGISVQQRIEEVLAKLCGKRVPIEGSSRTDSGVHALGMVASFRWSKTSVQISDLQRALNSLLPEDIRILELNQVRASFHARFNARSKLYRYRLFNASLNDPFRRKYVWYIHKPLDVSKMRKAAKHFLGKHDFSSVAANPGYERTTMVRTIMRCDVRRQKDEIHIEVEADGFLYKMVRTIVGTLVDVGLGKRTHDSIKNLIESRDRTKAGKTAPAHGLFLVDVKF